MIRRPPGSTGPDTPVPYPTLFRSAAAAARLLPAAAVAGDREAVGLVAYLLDQLQAGGCSTWMQLPGRLPVDARQQQGFVAGPARLALGPAAQIGRASCRERVCQYV